MNMQKTIGCVLIFGLISGSFASQKIGWPSRSQLEELAKARGVLRDGPVLSEVEFDEGDFDWPESGFLRKADVKNLAYIQSQTAHALQKVPEDIRQSNRISYERMQSLNEVIKTAAASGKQDDFFKVIHPLIELDEAEPSSDRFCEEIASAKAYLLQCGYYLVRAFAYHVVHRNGIVSAELLRQAVLLFSNDQLLDETAWDVDDLMPIDSSGLFILNPDLVMEEVKKRPLNRVTCFVRTMEEPSDFFEPYTADGDGLEVLKVTYAANKEVIDAKYRELVAWWRAEAAE